MKTIRIPLDEFAAIIKENERLKASEQYLKCRLDKGLCDMTIEMRDIKALLKGGETV